MPASRPTASRSCGGIRNFPSSSSRKTPPAFIRDLPRPRCHPSPQTWEVPHHVRELDIVIPQTKRSAGNRRKGENTCPLRTCQLRKRGDREPYVGSKQWRPEGEMGGTAGPKPPASDKLNPQTAPGSSKTRRKRENPHILIWVMGKGISFAAFSRCRSLNWASISELVVSGRASAYPTRHSRTGSPLSGPPVS